MLKHRQLNALEEEARLKVLQSYGVLGPEFEHELDNLVQLAAQIAKVEVAYICFVDREKVFLKSSVGVPDEYRTLPREVSFCQYTMLADEVVVVEDVAQVDALRNNPSVTFDNAIKFYASAPIVDEAGYALGCLCVLSDRPHRLEDHQVQALATLAIQVRTHLSLKKKNRELERRTQQAQEYLNIFKVSPEIHCTLDREGRILFINNAVSHLLGYTISEVLQKMMWEYCFTGDIQRTINYLSEGLRNQKKQFSLEFRLLTKSGELKWLAWNMVTNGERWYCHGHDITQKKREDEELKVLSLVASKTNVGVNICNKYGYTVWVNEAFTKITGFALEELKGHRLGDFLSSANTDLSIIEQARRNAQNNTGFEIEVLAKTKWGEELWFSVANTPILDEVGKIERQVELIANVTPRKLYEREIMEARERAIELSEAKEMFLSVMSHEIRTPLNAIIGLTHLLLDEEPKPAQINDLNLLKFSEEHLLSLVNDILDYSKIESGNLKLEEIDFNLADVTSDLMRSLQLTADKNGNELILEFDQNIPSNLIGDTTRLHQILINLIGNALKFTSNGRVCVFVRLLKKTAHSAEVYFEVTDTGIGIAEDKRDYIFETFTQAKANISRKYGGTGLGLAIVKKLLLLHNSAIEVQSEEGRGTTFRFKICYQLKKEGRAAAVTEDRVAEFSGQKVLVVEDNEINVLIAKRVFGKWGLAMDFAEDGHKAIEMVNQKRYDLILMDILMPGLDGFETTQVIRALPNAQNPRTPVIALTASTLSHDRQKYEDSGMDGHITKPFNPLEVKDVLRNIFKNQA